MRWKLRLTLLPLDPNAMPSLKREKFHRYFILQQHFPRYFARAFHFSFLFADFLFTTSSHLNGKIYFPRVRRRERIVFIMKSKISIDFHLMFSRALWLLSRKIIFIFFFISFITLKVKSSFLIWVYKRLMSKRSPAISWHGKLTFYNNSRELNICEKKPHYYLISHFMSH